MRIPWLAFAAPLLATACMLPPNVAILIPDETGTIGKAEIRNPGGTALLDRPYSTVGASDRAVDKPFYANFAQVDQEFAGVLSATPRRPVTFILYFLSGQTILDEPSMIRLEAVIARAKSTPNEDISVVGHADTTGSEAANIKISFSRADIVRGKLVDAGVPASVIEVASHGSQLPLVPTGPGIDEPKNRRVEVTIR